MMNIYIYYIILLYYYIIILLYYYINIYLYIYIYIYVGGGCLGKKLGTPVFLTCSKMET